MGIARSTYYDTPVSTPDDTAILEAIGAICGEFEHYGWRRVRAALLQQGHGSKPQEDQTPHARTRPSAEGAPTLRRDDG